MTWMAEHREERRSFSFPETQGDDEQKTIFFTVTFARLPCVNCGVLVCTSTI